MHEKNNDKCPVPSLSRMVHVVVDPEDNDGVGIATGIVTRVWHYVEELNFWVVNYNVMLQGGRHFIYVISAKLYTTKEVIPADMVHSSVKMGNMNASFWPPRV